MEVLKRIKVMEVLKWINKGNRGIEEDKSNAVIEVENRNGGIKEDNGKGGYRGRG